MKLTLLWNLSEQPDRVTCDFEPGLDWQTRFWRQLRYGKICEDASICSTLFLRNNLYSNWFRDRRSASSCKERWTNEVSDVSSFVYLQKCYACQVDAFRALKGERSYYISSYTPKVSDMVLTSNLHEFIAILEDSWYCSNRSCVKCLVEQQKRHASCCSTASNYLWSRENAIPRGHLNYNCRWLNGSIGDVFRR